MNIVHIASEIAPVAKVGGLADVLFGLSRALKKHFEENKEAANLNVIIPKYDCIDLSRISNLRLKSEFISFFDGSWHKNKLFEGEVGGITISLIEPQDKMGFFQRGTFYGQEDDILRFCYFSRAALDYLLHEKKTIDIFHVHDWQTALIAPLYKEIFEKMGLSIEKFIFTIHNLEHQGRLSFEALQKVGLFDKNSLAYMQDHLDTKSFNLMKGAIQCSTFTTTVSPTYAKEALSDLGGRGLSSVLLQKQEFFCGILNGIDLDYWNPENDQFIDWQYSLESIDKRELNKMSLKKLLHLEDSHKPLVGCITRLVPQKGIRAIIDAIHRTLDKGGQFVLLGSSPIQHIQDEFEALKKQYSSNPNIHFCLKNDEALAHKIYASCDLFIVPSLFEPCGLTQMIALRYGAIPLVRKTGGLADTIFDIDYTEKDKSNGFTYDFPDQVGLYSALDRALDLFYNQPLEWKSLQKRGMSQDLSWALAANTYLNLYKIPLKSKR